ncbi:MAG TPA: rhomboid family intramembrane serine protease [Alphaproteobacteria bacterium]|nr:rhomboid family intramembrane serine protease [Alphaproteobacteria bacterium]
MTDQPPTETPPAREPMFRIPSATGWLIALNVLVQVVRSLLPQAQDEIVENYLAVHTSALFQDFGLIDLASLFTYQFMHGGWDHLTANMVFLLAMGPGVERPVGKIPYLIIYLSAGVAGAFVEAAMADPARDDILVGASASISGVFGALIVIWRLYNLGAKPLGLVRMAGLLIAMMAITGILGVGAPEGMPIGWLAHIGGFLAGMAMGFVVRPPARQA